MKKAFITGITGQDGSYLAEFLLEKSYEVYGLVRRVALADDRHHLSRLTRIIDQIEIIPGSLDNLSSIYKAVSKVKPDEIYHLAAQSFVSYSFNDEFSTIRTNIDGTHHLLSSTKEIVPHARFYFAGSSEMFGKAEQNPQNEKTPFHPRSVYGISKVAGFHLVQYYREAFNLFACNGILYNHESPRRGMEFVTRKITNHVAKIKLGLADKLVLGNLDARRDWGHANDYVKAMWMMLQQQKPDDYVICTGIPCSVRNFCKLAFAYAGMDYRDYVTTDQKYFRPSEVDMLLGDYSKAKNELGWEPTISLDMLVAEMVEHDLHSFSERYNRQRDE